MEAVASGHKAAESIHRYLRGEELEPKPKPELPVVKFTPGELQSRLARGTVRKGRRVPMPELPVAARVRGLGEVGPRDTAEQ